VLNNKKYNNMKKFLVTIWQLSNPFSESETAIPTEMIVFATSEKNALEIAKKDFKGCVYDSSVVGA
jgi:hypothetical protein